jgi:hypothetical protein
MNQNPLFDTRSHLRASAFFEVELAPSIKTHFVKVIASDAAYRTKRVVNFTTP